MSFGGRYRNTVSVPVYPCPTCGREFRSQTARRLHCKKDCSKKEAMCGVILVPIAAPSGDQRPGWKFVPGTHLPGGCPRCGCNDACC